MHIIADLCLVPLGVGVSVSPYIAACQKILTDAGLTIHLHAYGTNIEGDWDTVFAAIKNATKPSTPWAPHASPPPSKSAPAPTAPNPSPTKSKASTKNSNPPPPDPPPN